MNKGSFPLAVRARRGSAFGLNAGFASAKTATRRFDLSLLDLDRSNNVLLLPFDEDNLATSTLDLSSYNHTATFNGNAKISSGVFKHGKASLALDGSGDYLSIVHASEFNMGATFSVEAWIYLTGYSSGYSGNYTSVIVSKDASGARCWGFQITGTSSSWTGLNLIVFDNGGSYDLASKSYTFSLNTWYHVAAVRVSNNLRLFVNGTQIGTDVASSRTVAAHATNITIGGQVYTSYEYYFPGYIDDIRIKNGSSAYSTTFFPPGPLYKTLYWYDGTLSSNYGSTRKVHAFNAATGAYLGVGIVRSDGYFRITTVTTPSDGVFICEIPQHESALAQTLRL